MEEGEGKVVRCSQYHAGSVTSVVGTLKTSLVPSLKRGQLKRHCSGLNSEVSRHNCATLCVFSITIHNTK